MKLKSLIIAAALTAASSMAFAGYSSTVLGATIYSPGTYYQTNFPIVGPTPAAGTKITGVSYNWDTGTVPDGRTLTVYLCHGSTSACLNVSSAKSGTTQAFAGRDETVTFFLYYMVSGSTPMTSISGKNDQVIVNP